MAPHRTFISAATVAIVAATAAPAAAQQQQQYGGTKSYLAVNALGDIVRKQTPSPANIHFHGNLDVQTADYFRGRFDGVDDDFDAFAYQIGAAATVELLRAPRGLLRSLNLTAGSANGLTDPDETPDGTWYESDNYIGVTANLGRQVAGALTYTIFTSPDSVAEAQHELAATAQVTGPGTLGLLAPQVKLALGLEDREGFFVEAGLNPSLQAGTVAGRPLTLTVPLRVGVGFADYYGDETSATYWLVGVDAEMPLPEIPPSYGNWSFHAGLTLDLRDEEIQELDASLDDTGEAAVTAVIGLRFAY